MKVIMLDVDGVLNHTLAFQYQGTRMAIDGACVRRLKKIVDMTSAKIVVSSTWRIYPNNLDLLKIRLREFNLEVFDCTPMEWPGSNRPKEIIRWLFESDNKVDSFIILDDHVQIMTPAKFIPSWKMVQTSMSDGGLQDEHVDEAIEFLNQ